MYNNKINRGSGTEERKERSGREEEGKERKGWRREGILSWVGKRNVEVSPCSHHHRTHSAPLLISFCSRLTTLHSCFSCSTYTGQANCAPVL